MIGDVALSGEGPGETAAIVLLTECGTSNVDYFELENVGNMAADTAGWFILPNNANSATGGLNSVNAAWQLPANVSVSQVIAISGNTPGYIPADRWSSGFNGTRNGWCMLCDKHRAVREFVAWVTRRTISSITCRASRLVVKYTNLTFLVAVTGNGAAADHRYGDQVAHGNADERHCREVGHRKQRKHKGRAEHGTNSSVYSTASGVPVSPTSATM